MNLILVTAEDFIDDKSVKLSDSRHTHISKVHKAVTGQALKVGMLNGNTGTGTVVSIDDQSVTLTLALNTKPLPPLPLTLILALPRPKMLKRILQCVASLGVKDIYLINSYKVEKSYWSSPVLEASSIEQQLLLGLEQAGDTLMPKVHLRKRFKPFIEDELPAIAEYSRKIIAHPYNAHTFEATADQPTTLAIGPEGGFIDYEVEKLCSQGFAAMSLGSRILRVETALPVAISKLFSF
ncbi:MAG: 16S rRNA (uracil(1498)-N(3))-methyltransferase [Oceanospirillaceae bacterium]|nr:16S rRNA (uracil(1498)-N(3))-methyltransferase [Oceanospirillaceae bacterium]